MKIKAVYLKKIYNLSNNVHDETYIYQDDKVLTFQHLGAGNSVLLESIITTNSKKGNTIAFPTNKIKNILNILNDDDELELLEKDDYLLIKFKNYKRKIRKIFPDKERFTLPDERDKQALSFTNDIDIISSAIKNSLRASSDIIGDVYIISNKESFKIKREDETDEFEFTINKSNSNLTINKAKDDIKNRYASVLLNELFANIDGIVNIKIIRDGPIKITSQPFKNLKFKYMIAPLIKNETDDD